MRREARLAELPDRGAWIDLEAVIFRGERRSKTAVLMVILARHALAGGVLLQLLTCLRLRIQIWSNQCLWFAF